MSLFKSGEIYYTLYFDKNQPKGINLFFRFSFWGKGESVSANILTPVGIWGDFKVSGEANYTVLSETVKDGVVFTRFTIDGKKTDGAATIISLLSARSEKLAISPCVFVLPDFEKDIDEDFLFDLAKRGYFAVSADFSGKKEGKEYYTVYPSGAERANFEATKNSLYEIPVDVKNSAWYEWGAVAKYSLSYLYSRTVVTGVGAVGIGLGASVLWQVAPTEELSCAAFLFDAGWNTYHNKGNHKFDGVTPVFDDNDLTVLAGVDAQAYAASVKIPSLVLTATNSVRYDFDRAFDTVSRMTKSPYAAIDYAVNRVDVIDRATYNDLVFFLSSVLLKGSAASLPAAPDIECYIEDGTACIEVDAVTEGLKSVSLYAAEGEVLPNLRSWKVVSTIDADDISDGQFFFKYLPYSDSGAVYFFVRAKYEGEYTVSSQVASKTFSSSDVKNPHKSKIIYSGREKYSESVFSPVNVDNNSFIDTVCLKEEKGPLDIVGLKSTSGLITYKINSAKDKPNGDSIFVLDVCAESGTEILFSLLTEDDFKGTVYTAKLVCPPVRSWRNFTVGLNRFKSPEGFGLKDFSKVTAIRFTAKDDFLINNFLWI